MKRLLFLCLVIGLTACSRVNRICEKAGKTVTATCGSILIKKAGNNMTQEKELATEQTPNSFSAERTPAMLLW